MAKDIIKLSFQPGSPIILVCAHLALQNSKGNRLSSSNKNMSIGKINYFQPIPRYILEMVQDRAIATMER